MKVQKITPGMLLLILFLAAAGCAPLLASGETQPDPTQNADVQPVASPTPPVAAEPPQAQPTRPAPTGLPAAESTEPSPPQKTWPERCNTMTEIARGLLAEEQNIPLDSIEALRCYAVEWPDASLGCPQPGQMYAQVITPGFQILLEAGGKRYVVHTDTTQNAVVCSLLRESEEFPDIPVLPGEDIDDGIPWVPVD